MPTNATGNFPHGCFTSTGALLLKERHRVLGVQLVNLERGHEKPLACPNGRRAGDEDSARCNPLFKAFEK